MSLPCQNALLHGHGELKLPKKIYVSSHSSQGLTQRTHGHGKNMSKPMKLPISNLNISELSHFSDKDTYEHVNHLRI